MSIQNSFYADPVCSFFSVFLASLREADRFPRWIGWGSVRETLQNSQARPRRSAEFGAIDRSDDRERERPSDRAFLHFTLRIGAISEIFPVFVYTERRAARVETNASIAATTVLHGRRFHCSATCAPAL